jgi:hypothetical protein
MPDIFIPTLHTFAMGNTFTGSWENLRFKIVPNVVKLTPKEVNMAESSITAKFWHGIFCYEKSTIEGEQTFPMSEEGRAAMKQWLEQQI